jgi:hypothetical protein
VVHGVAITARLPSQGPAPPKFIRGFFFGLDSLHRSDVIYTVRGAVKAVGIWKAQPASASISPARA